MQRRPDRSLTLSRRAVAGVCLISMSVVACSGTPSTTAPPATVALADTEAPAATAATTAPADTAVSAAPVTAAPPVPASTVPPTRFDGKVTLADGGWLVARCTGTGRPTILLEAGGTAGNMQAWGSIFPVKLASHATVCRYTHRGGEGSSEAPSPLTWASVLADADALLATVEAESGIGGPYVFVGWSFGGAVALGEAIAHRADTVGLVILDTDFLVDFMSTCQAGGRTAADCQAEFDSDREAKAIERDLIKTITPIPEIPIIVVSALRPSPDCALEPGAPAVTYQMSGKEISAPDCATLMLRIADEHLAQWSSIGKVTQTRVGTDHGGLIRDARQQIEDLIFGLITEHR